MYVCDRSRWTEGLILSPSLPWELGKSLIKWESVARPQEKCQVGGGGAENLPAGGGPEVPGLQGRALRAWPVLPTFVQAASQPHSPAPCMPGGGSQGKLSGLGPGAPRPSQPNGTSRSTASAQGCPRARLPSQQGGVAWGLACVWGAQ